MRRERTIGLTIAVAVGLAVGVVAHVRSVGAEVFHQDALRIIGDGVTVTCNTTPAAIDDTSVPDDALRWLVCFNTAAADVAIGTGTPGANTPPVQPGQTWKAKLERNAAAKCYAAAPTAIRCQEML